MFKRDYERAALHVRKLRQQKVKPIIIESTIDAYLFLFQSKPAFDPMKWFAAINQGMRYGK